LSEFYNNIVTDDKPGLSLVSSKSYVLIFQVICHILYCNVLIEFLK